MEIIELLIDKKPKNNNSVFSGSIEFVGIDKDGNNTYQTKTIENVIEDKKIVSTETITQHHKIKDKVLISSDEAITRKGK